MPAKTKRSARRGPRSQGMTTTNGSIDTSDNCSVLNQGEYLVSLVERAMAKARTEQDADTELERATAYWSAHLQEWGQDDILSFYKGIKLGVPPMYSFYRVPALAHQLGCADLGIPQTFAFRTQTTGDIKHDSFDREHGERVFAVPAIPSFVYHKVPLQWLAAVHMVNAFTQLRRAVRALLIVHPEMKDVYHRLLLITNAGREKGYSSAFTSTDQHVKNYVKAFVKVTYGIHNLSSDYAEYLYEMSPFSDILPQSQMFVRYVKLAVVCFEGANIPCALSAALYALSMLTMTSMLDRLHALKACTATPEEAAPRDAEGRFTLDALRSRLGEAKGIGLTRLAYTDTLHWKSAYHVQKTANASCPRTVNENDKTSSLLNAMSGYDEVLRSSSNVSASVVNTRSVLEEVIQKTDYEISNGLGDVVTHGAVDYPHVPFCCTSAGAIGEMSAGYREWDEKETKLQPYVPSGFIYRNVQRNMNRYSQSLISNYLWAMTLAGRSCAMIARLVPMCWQQRMGIMDGDALSHIQLMLVGQEYERASAPWMSHLAACEPRGSMTATVYVHDHLFCVPVARSLCKDWWDSVQAPSVGRHSLARSAHIREADYDSDFAQGCKGLVHYLWPLCRDLDKYAHELRRTLVQYPKKAGFSRFTDESKHMDWDMYSGLVYAPNALSFTYFDCESTDNVTTLLTKGATTVYNAMVSKTVAEEGILELENGVQQTHYTHVLESACFRVQTPHEMMTSRLCVEYREGLAIRYGALKTVSFTVPIYLKAFVHYAAGTCVSLRLNTLDTFLTKHFISEKCPDTLNIAPSCSTNETISTLLADIGFASGFPAICKGIAHMIVPHLCGHIIRSLRRADVEIPDDVRRYARDFKRRFSECLDKNRQTRPPFSLLIGPETHAIDSEHQDMDDGTDAASSLFVGTQLIFITSYLKQMLDT